MRKYKDFKFDTSDNIKGYHNKLRKVIKFGNYVVEPLHYTEAIKLLDAKTSLEYSSIRDGSGSVVVISDTFELLFLCDPDTKLFFPLVGLSNK